MLTLLLLVLINSSSFAVPKCVITDTSRVRAVEISEEGERKIFSDKAYIYKEDELKRGQNFVQDFLDWFKEDKVRDEREEEEARSRDYSSGDTPGDLWTGEGMKGLMLIICILVLVGGLVYLFATGKHKVLFAPKPLETPFDFKEITEDIEGLNIDKLIEEARLRGDFRLATRWWYLKLLKKFTTQGLILWKPHKTNFDYFGELKDSSYLPTFKIASYVYENVWYGEMPVDESVYNKYIPTFVALEKSIHA